MTEPVIMEVLAGARSDQRELDLRRLLLRFRLLRFEAAADFDAAARMYRRCRAAGFTPRGMVDCMIAAVAWRHGASLLAQDVDLLRLGQIVHAADVAEDIDTDPIGRGLEAIALGYSLRFPEDMENLEHQFEVYDALYAWCRLQVLNT